MLVFFRILLYLKVVKFDFSVTKVVGDFVGESICSLSCPFAVLRRVFARFHRTFGVLHAIKKDPKNWVIFSLRICEQSKQKTIFFYLLLFPSRCRKKWIYKIPKALWMIHFNKVTKFMNDYIVDYWWFKHDNAKIEWNGATTVASTPPSFCVVDFDGFWCNFYKVGQICNSFFQNCFGIFFIPCFQFW